MKNKKIPLRKCIGCNEQKTKKELIRVVRNKEGEVSVDFNGKSHGRGAYICHDSECLEKAKKRKALERAFGTQISDEIFEKLFEEIKNER